MPYKRHPPAQRQDWARRIVVGWAVCSRDLKESLKLNRIGRQGNEKEQLEECAHSSTMPLKQKRLAWGSRLFSIAMIGALLTSMPGSGQQSYHTYRRPVIQVPVSLAIGRFQTPPFHLKKKGKYAIILQIAKRLPFDELWCKFGLTLGGADDDTAPIHCSEEPVLQAEWTVRNGDGKAVARGKVNKPGGEAVFLNRYILRYIGYFKGQRGKSYTLEIEFTKDGSSLNVCDPHLIVMRTGYDYMSM